MSLNLLNLLSFGNSIGKFLYFLIIKFGLPSKMACNEYFIDFYSHSNAINIWCMEKMRFIRTVNNESIKKTAIFRAAVCHNIMANRFDGCEKTNICAYGALMGVFLFKVQSFLSFIHLKIARVTR